MKVTTRRKQIIHIALPTKQCNRSQNGHGGRVASFFCRTYPDEKGSVEKHARQPLAAFVLDGCEGAGDIATLGQSVQEVPEARNDTLKFDGVSGLWEQHRLVAVREAVGTALRPLECLGQVREAETHEDDHGKKEHQKDEGQGLCVVGNGLDHVHQRRSIVHHWWRKLVLKRREEKR